MLQDTDYLIHHIYPYCQHVKLWTTGRARHVTSGANDNAYKRLVNKPQRTMLRGWCKRRWEDNTKMGVKRWGMNWEENLNGSRQHPMSD
jgi:uncharacterized protein YlaI